MIETHPFGIFVPPKAKFLLLGSFTTKEANFDPTYDWFYGTKRNHFWPILREVYSLPLENLQQKKELFSRLKLALGDVILQCERVKNSNLDMNLINIVYNIAEVEKVLSENKIDKIFFSSRFVEGKFRRYFKKVMQDHPEIELITLPSPSPRFAAMSRQKKVEKYKVLLPRL